MSARRNVTKNAIMAMIPNAKEAFNMVHVLLMFRFRYITVPAIPVLKLLQSVVPGPRR